VCAQVLRLSCGFASIATLEKGNRTALAQVHSDMTLRRLSKNGTVAPTNLEIKREQELDNQRRELIHRAWERLQDPSEVHRLLKDYAKAILAA
jgi:hypothetical protein